MYTEESKFSPRVQKLLDCGSHDVSSLARTSGGSHISYVEVEWVHYDPADISKEVPVVGKRCGGSVG